MNVDISNKILLVLSSLLCSSNCRWCFSMKQFKGYTKEIRPIAAYSQFVAIVHTFLNGYNSCMLHYT